MPVAVARHRSCLRVAPFAASVLLMLSASPAGASVGSASPGSTVDSDSPGRGEAFRVKAATTQTVDQLNLYLDRASTASRVDIGLYASASGKPAARLARCAVANPVAGWYNACAVAPVTVTSARSYWLAVLQPAGTSGSVRFRVSEGAGASYGSSQSSLTALPSSWSAGAYWGAQTLSAYGDQAGGPAPAPDPTPGPDPAPAPAPDPAPATSPPPSGPVTYQPIDGGPAYFASKSAHSAWMDGHILLGAWMEQPQSAAEVGNDAALGENIYWNLSGHPGGDRVDYDVIRAGGMHAAAPDRTSKSGSETVAYDGSDESDMNYGPGTNGWNASSNHYNQTDCVPSGSQCGYTAASWFYSSGTPSYPFDGSAIHQGYGKGVLFWESDAQATRFMNYSDILSADSYWMTDSDLHYPSQGGCALLPGDATACGSGNGSGLTNAQTHLPANYAYDVTRLRRLQAANGSSKPIVVDVETGCPGSNNACTTPSAAIASAWHALIAGARGIVWFQHNFSGPCVDFRTLIDGSNPSSSMYGCQQTPGVTLHGLVGALTAFDKQASSLESVLLSPTATNYVATSGVLSSTAKCSGGSFYVFAGSGRPATPPPANQSVTFKTADGYTGPVTVVGENRTLQATSGSFADTFADANAVHVYRIDSGSSC